MSPSVTSWSTHSPPSSGREKHRNRRTLTGLGSPTFDPSWARGGRQASKVRQLPYLEWCRCSELSRKCHPGGSTWPSFLTPQHPGLCPSLLHTQRGTEREGTFIKHLLHASCYFMVKETESQESKGAFRRHTCNSEAGISIRNQTLHSELASLPPPWA